MKAYLKIASYLALLLLLTAEDCGDSQTVSYATKEDIYQSIEDEFTTDDMSIETLSAFEKRAIQKFNDVADYMNIYADTSYSAEFRIQAGTMIEDAFYSEQDMQKFLNELGLKEDLLSHLLISSDGKQIQIRVDSIGITEEFHRISDTEYQSELSFKYFLNESALTEKAKVIASKTSKQFGNDSIFIWELYFSI